MKGGCLTYLGLCDSLISALMSVYFEHNLVNLNSSKLSSVLLVVMVISVWVATHGRLKTSGPVALLYGFPDTLVTLCLQDVCNSDVTRMNDLPCLHHVHLVWLDVIQKPLQTPAASL